MDCSGSQDRCIEGTATFNGQTFPINGCANKAACESVASFWCCEGNLCNGAQCVTQSVLFLCCSLLSYFLMH
ncbi:hypothetical protein R3I93_014330 [Phoxinus phoxinus]|uniref:Uncharacterized protein n=1 Tax=Phoxinus phoxinus TaxID=58324 RepID=A0AAN9H109_9TELE